MLDAAGKTPQDIAAQLDCSTTTVYELRTSQEYLDKRDDITLADRRITKAGITRIYLQLLEKKLQTALDEGDRDTAGYMLKSIREMTGTDEVQEQKQKITVVVE